MTVLQISLHISSRHMCRPDYIHGVTGAAAREDLRCTWLQPGCCDADGLRCRTSHRGLRYRTRALRLSEDLLGVEVESFNTD